jgi:hypothetical protein
LQGEFFNIFAMNVLENFGNIPINNAVLYDIINDYRFQRNKNGHAWLWEGIICSYSSIDHDKKRINITKDTNVMLYCNWGMIMRNIILIFFLFSSLLTILCGCSSDEIEFEEVYIWVSPELTQWHNADGDIRNIMQVKFLNGENSENEMRTISKIYGFDYKEGYTYILHIRIEPIKYEDTVSPEAPRIKYSLLKIILKEKVN